MRVTVGLLGGLLLMIPGTSVAQVSQVDWGPLLPGEPRFRLDVNFGMADSLAKDREFNSRFISFGELGTANAHYPTPSTTATFVDIGGSYMFSRTYGVGAAYSRTSWDDVVGLSTTIPHPTFYGIPASSTGLSGELTRTEGAAHIFLVGIPVRTFALEWRIFGGPSIFWLNADMVDEVLYEQTLTSGPPQNAITVSGVTTSEASASTVGFHIGSEFDYFFTNLFGIGGGFRYSYGTAAVAHEPLSTLEQDIRVGSTQFFAGLRFRFGGN